MTVELVCNDDVGEWVYLMDYGDRWGFAVD